MKIDIEPMEKHGAWFGYRLYRHLLRKFKRDRYALANLTRMQRVVILSMKETK